MAVIVHGVISCDLVHCAKNFLSFVFKYIQSGERRPNICFTVVVESGFYNLIFSERCLLLNPQSED